MSIIILHDVSDRYNASRYGRANPTTEQAVPSQLYREDVQWIPALHLQWHGNGIPFILLQLMEDKPSRTWTPIEK